MALLEITQLLLEAQRPLKLVEALEMKTQADVVRALEHILLLECCFSSGLWAGIDSFCCAMSQLILRTLWHIWSGAIVLFAYMGVVPPHGSPHAHTIGRTRRRRA